MQYEKLTSQLDGEFYTNNIQRTLYATDASSYREMPQAVAKPKSKEDIKHLIKFARETNTSIIPRAGGTSLAGQVVGGGIVVDISKYLNKIIEFNKEERWVVVEPGVVLSELNQYLAPHGLLFGPETSTANRCCIGGMLGNNSCGLHSIIHGSVREHVLQVEAILADGSEVTFMPLSKAEFEAKCAGDPNLLDTKIYQNIRATLADAKNQETIRNEFPHPDVTRRNNGYAIDVLLNSEVFTNGGEQFNFCKLLAGSEGTLAFSHRIKLNLLPLPPKYKGLVCAHFKSLEDALEGNLVALKHKPDAVELMDDIIMDCTKQNIEQRKNRFFIQGDPVAMLMIEFSKESQAELDEVYAKLQTDFKAAKLGYNFPMVTGADIAKVWNLRKAGLGLLANVPGDKISATLVEDTAIAPQFLPAYIKDFKQLLKKYNTESVYYAHIATGELHIRPLLNLKDPQDIKKFKGIANDVAALVKKYRGSLSGEHGDGRLRGEFIPFMLGEHNYQLIRELKHTWDPFNVFNPGKIIDTPPITDNFRIEAGTKLPELETTFDFSKEGGMFRSIEKCNGTGDCRKTVLSGGTMCPTYMVTRDEDKTTRGRANALREFLLLNQKKNPFDSKEIYEVLELCISCKACKSECPSNIDMAKFKAEFMQQYFAVHGIPLRSRLIAYLPVLNEISSMFSGLTNALMKTSGFKRMLGFAPDRQLPKLSKKTLRKQFKQENNSNSKGTVYLFADEFTNCQESDLGVKTVLLLRKLGYDVIIPKHKASARTFLSKGLVKTSKKIATQNILLLKDKISEATPLIGIEPSAILTFRDEYPELVDTPLQNAARKLGENALLFEEFFCNEVEKGNIKAEVFTTNEAELLYHGHCHQKSVASTNPTLKMLSFPKNYRVNQINSGCCGMAGSFGYEKEHVELSMKIGELSLFPAVRSANAETIIVASGTSCRHQIADGTNREAKHPVEIMLSALRN